MADEQDAADSGSDRGSAYYQPTTTPEAQKYARTILDKQIGGGNEKGEAAILDEMATNNKRAIAALRAAQQSMAGVQYDPRPNQANVAGALLAPTHSGSTSESLGKGFEQYGAGLGAQRNFELERLKALLEYQQKIADKPDELTRTKLDLQKLHETQAGPLGKEALTVLGRSIVPGSGIISPNGKIAATEGLTPGSPAFIARVKRLDALDQRNKAATAGTDYDAVKEPDHTADALRYGVPTEAPYPWNGASSRERKQMLQTERTAANKELSVQDAGVQQAQAVQRDLDRFGFLNGRTATSSWQGVPGISQITGMGQDAKEMDKIAARLGPMMRQPGMGRMTNLDLQTFMASTVGRDKPKQVNDDIRTAMGIGIKNQLDSNEFMHNYFAVHRTLQGAREAWDDYLNKNPIFDPTAPEGSFHINKGRLGYKEYFRSLHPQGGDIVDAGEGSAGPSQFADVTQADRDDPVNAGLTDEQIHASKIPAKARGGKVRYADGGTVQNMRDRLRLMQDPVTGTPSKNLAPVREDPGVQSPEQVAAMERLRQLMATPINKADGGKVKTEDDYEATLKDLARSLEQGATFQWGDELNSSVSPGAYRENTTSERGQQERFAGSHPWSNLGLEAAGGVGTSLAAAKLAQMAIRHGTGRAGTLGRVAALASRLTPRAALPKALVTGAAAGAGAGALSGAGAAQDLESTPRMATEGAAEGAVLGPLAGLVTKYGVNGAMALVDKVRGAGVPAGARKVLDALKGDRTTVDEIASRLRASNRQGVPSMVSDVGGPRIQALSQGVASKEGPAVDTWTDALRTRQASSNDRVGDLVNRALKPDDYSTKLKELTTNLYQQAKPLYEQAYAAYPKVKSDVIFDLLGNKYGKKAAKQAFSYMEADGVPIGQKDVTGAIRKPSLQYLDYVKRGLDDQIESANRSGDTNLARILNNMKKRLVNELDTQTTDPATGSSLYKAAREQYAGDAEVVNALKTGREDLTKLTPQEIRDKVANMSWAERDALRTGAAESLFQQIGNSPLNSNVATKLANIPNVQQKLAAMFDKPGEYQTFMDGLTREMQNFNQAKTVLATQARSRAGAAAADLEPTGAPGEMAYEGTLAASGHPLWAGARLAKVVGNKLMGNNTADQAAQVLQIQANPAGRTQLDMLKQQAALLAAREGRGDLAGAAGAGAVGPVTAPEPWGNTEQGYSDGGKVGKLGDAIKALLGQTAEKADQVGAEKFRSNLADSVADRMKTMQDKINSTTYKYKVGDTIYTQQGGPYKIVDLRTMNHYPEDVAAIKQGTRTPKEVRQARPDLPAYYVQGPNGEEFSMAEWGALPAPPTGADKVN